MTSIVTRFLGPTNSRGARIAAQVSDYGSDMERYSRENGKPGRLIVAWDHGFCVEENHKRAAMALAQRLEWSGRWYGDDAPGSAGYVFTRGAVQFFVEETIR
jgi:hypothetical protein